MTLKRTFLVLVGVLVGLDSAAYDTVTISKADLGREFLQEVQGAAVLQRVHRVHQLHPKRQ